MLGGVDSAGGFGGSDGEAEGIAGNDGQDSNAGLGNGWGGFSEAEAALGVSEGAADSELGMSAPGSSDGVATYDVDARQRSRARDMGMEYGRRESNKGILGTLTSLDPTGIAKGLLAQSKASDMHSAVTGEDMDFSDRAKAFGTNAVSHAVGNLFGGVITGVTGRALGGNPVGQMIGKAVGANIGQEISDALYGGMTNNTTTANDVSSDNSINSDGLLASTNNNNPDPTPTDTMALSHQSDTRLDNFYGFREAETALRTV